MSTYKKVLTTDKIKMEAKSVVTADTFTIPAGYWITDIIVVTGSGTYTSTSMVFSYTGANGTATATLSSVIANNTRRGIILDHIPGATNTLTVTITNPPTPSSTIDIYVHLERL